MADARRTLPLLRQEWEGCTRCSLGEFREANGNALVFGEGVPGSIMFIGDNPSEDDASSGRPFSGLDGLFLRKLLKRIGITHYYLTNIVACRSFAYVYDESGNQRHSRGRPIMHNAPPNIPQITACKPRLEEEIYLVDPILIVTLGGTAAEAVLGRPVKIMQESGNMRTDMANEPGTVLRLPGAGAFASLTPKGAWRRKVKGEWIMPTHQSVVEYPVIPLLSPSYVLSSEADKSLNSPRDSFARGMTRVKSVYMEYMHTMFSEALNVHTMFGEGGSVAPVSIDEIDIAAMEE